MGWELVGCGFEHRAVRYEQLIDFRRSLPGLMMACRSVEGQILQMSGTGGLVSSA